MDYIINLYKNNRIIETRKTPVVINGRRITLTCSNIDKIQLYDDIQRYIATYYYCFKQNNKITFEKRPYSWDIKVTRLMDDLYLKKEIREALNMV